MRILILHNSYKNAGGEDTVVKLESNHLTLRGHEVRLEILSNDEIKGTIGKSKALYEVAGSKKSAARVGSWLSEFNPEVVHIHNFFPLLTPQVHLKIAREGVAVVQTLHNFRLMCAGALFLRDGTICEKCLGSPSWPALKHRCYRGSLPGTAAVLAMQRATLGSKKWLGANDRFIALTEFGRAKFIEGGLPAEKIKVKPNFVSDPGSPLPMAARTSGAIFVGRLSEEKGALDLVSAWRAIPDLPLDIIGDGPDMERLISEAPANVRFRGRLSYDETLNEIRNARMLLFPSRWYEGFPMTLAEAMAAGTPIVAARLGAAHAILADQSFARLYAPGDPVALQSAVRDLMNDESDHVAAARAHYLSKYTPEANMAKLEKIYAEAIHERHRVVTQNSV